VEENEMAISSANRGVLIQIGLAILLVAALIWLGR
jgi:hypothetical protein